MSNAIAELPDAKDADIEHSLRILDGLQERWAILCENLSEDEWGKVGLGSSSGQADYSLEDLARVYSGTVSTTSNRSRTSSTACPHERRLPAHRRAASI